MRKDVVESIRPIWMLVYRRSQMIRAGQVAPLTKSLCAAHACDAFSCTILSSESRPALSICVESGLLHQCSNMCDEARMSLDGVCPISGRAYPELSEHDETPRASAQSTHTLARSARAAFDPDLRLSRGDAVYQWTQVRHAIVSGRAEKRIRELIFSERRRRHDSRLLELERSRLAQTLFKYLRSRAANGSGLDAVTVVQFLRASANRLAILGVRPAGAAEPAAWANAIRSIAARCATTWVQLEREYGKVDVLGHDQSAPSDMDIEQLVTGVGKTTEPKSLIARAGVRCLTLEIRCVTGSRPVMRSFRVHVTSALLSYCADYPDLLAVLPSEKYLRSCLR